jgi:PEP-CTERM motif
MHNLKKLALATTLALVASVGGANASVLYDLTFTPSSGGTIGGTGTMTISSAPLTGLNQVSNYYQTPPTPPNGAGTLSALSITFGSDVFNLADKNNGSNPLVQFTTGTLDDITYAGTAANGDSLMITSQFVYFTAANREQEIGTFTAVDPPLAPVPEPITLSVFGAGLAGAAAMRRRKKANPA